MSRRSAVAYKVMYVIRFSLGSFLLLTATIAVALTCTNALGLSIGLLLSSIVTGLTFGIFRRRLLMLAAFVQITLLALLWVVTVIDLAITGPYVTWYNQRLWRLATDAQLVGDSQERVEAVLGPAHWVWHYLSSHGDGVTYEYAPYPHFPYATVQVHCRDGKVESVELYDD